MGLCTVTRDESDKRARVVALTEAGRALMARAPLAGPIRLRAMEHDPQALDRMSAAFEEAVGLFGLEDFLQGKKGAR